MLSSRSVPHVERISPTPGVRVRTRGAARLADRERPPGWSSASKGTFLSPAMHRRRLVLSGNLVRRCEPESCTSSARPAA